MTLIFVSSNKAGTSIPDISVDKCQANTVVQMYALKHADYTFAAWHVFVAYVITTWVACLLVCFCNRAMPGMSQAGIFFIIAGFFVTIIVL